MKRALVVILIGSCLISITSVSARQAGTTPIPVGGAIRAPIKTRDVPPDRKSVV